MVVKDWGHAPFLLRCFGWWSLQRESRLLRRLRGIDGIPDLVAREGHAIVMTYLEGKTLSSQVARELPATFFDRLDRLVLVIHDRGIVHLDLRQRRNVLVGPDGDPRILDFGAGIDLGRWGWIGRLGLKWLGSVDRLALLKLKGKYAPLLLRDHEHRRAGWARRARYFWPPNWLHVVKTRFRRHRRNRSGGNEGQESL